MVDRFCSFVAITVTITIADHVQAICVMYTRIKFSICNDLCKYQMNAFSRISIGDVIRLSCFAWPVINRYDYVTTRICLSLKHKFYCSNSAYVNRFSLAFLLFSLMMRKMICCRWHFVVIRGILLLLIDFVITLSIAGYGDYKWTWVFWW